MDTSDAWRTAKHERDTYVQKFLKDDRQKLFKILQATGARWANAKELLAHPLAKHDDGRRWNRRHLALVAYSFRGRVISHAFGYRLQENTPRELILDAARYAWETGWSTVYRGNDVIQYFNARVNGKLTLPVMTTEPHENIKKLSATAVAGVQMDLYDPRT